MTPREEDLDAPKGKNDPRGTGEREREGGTTKYSGRRKNRLGWASWLRGDDWGRGGRMGMKKRGEKKGTTLAMKLRVR